MGESALKQFGEQVKNIRLGKEMSQECLAEKADLHRTYIGGVERGERNIGLLNIIRIASALDVSPQVFFKSKKNY